MNDNPSPSTPGEAALRVLLSWLLVGISTMSLLQFVQLVAAIAATVYTVLQTYWLVRDRRAKKGPTP